ncbi:hypothetical protein [Crossiella cryophila]|uniref:Uncharacterized protein n=1 Tax=Crossiella cryophila TaxID=43355 RepID=A0A7W7CE88_9PSEU|nr:hypothetical protein [Crossiella cryophila]MBB4679570.1 hypothetical protein [Crossiella cryophila]
MTLREIDDSWVGDDLADLLAYFAADPPEFGPHRVVAARCADCAGQVFVLETDESGTCVRRTCAGCDRTVPMLDSAENWPTLDEEAEARYFVECTCGEDNFETAVGFTFRDDTPTADVHWIYVAIRCVADGRLGYCASWRISYGPSHHLVDSV